MWRAVAAAWSSPERRHDVQRRVDPGRDTGGGYDSAGVDVALAGPHVGRWGDVAQQVERRGMGRHW